MDDEDKLPEKELRVRNVHCETGLDHLNAANKDLYQGMNPELRVPTIRMFGITENGEKCLFHLHGILPYFLLRTRTPFSEELKQHIGRIVVRCAQLLELALKPGYPILASLEPLLLKDMYGFHETDDHFIKVVFYDFHLCRRIGTMLQKECSKDKLLQPYLTHIPYLQQFFIDYGIAGMEIVRFKTATFRRISLHMEADRPDWQRSVMEPLSFMAVEADVLAADIICEQSPSRQTSYQCAGLEFIWREEEMRCRVRQKVLEKPKRPEWGIPVLKTELEQRYKSQLKDVLVQLTDGSRPSSRATTSSEFLLSQSVFEGESLEDFNRYEMTEIAANQDRETWDRQERQMKGDVEEEDHDEAAEALEMTQLIDAVNDDEPMHEAMQIFTSDSDSDNNEVPGKFVEVEANFLPLFVSSQVEMEPDTCGSSCSYRNVPTNETWCAEEDCVRPLERTVVFDFESPTKQSSSQKKAATDLFKESMRISSVQHLSVLAVEAFYVCNPLSMEKRNNKAAHLKFLPDAESDPLVGIFFSFYNDICNRFAHPTEANGVVIEGTPFAASEFPHMKVVANEGDAFRWFADVLRRLDPDMLIGYDVHRCSLGYLVRRAAVLGLPSFGKHVSRISMPKQEVKQLDDVKGRILLNVWEIVRWERPMRHYRFSAVVAEVLGKRFADLSQAYLERILTENDPVLNAVIFRHFLRKSDLTVQLLVTLDSFIRTCQMARVYGIQFTEVISRGSQFRVESLLLRLARSHGFAAPSVSVEQRNAMPSPETMPLTLEPRSGIYYDPVVVLDFQSLYPSVCIAYNYCFTTCLGRLNEWKSMGESYSMQLGALSFSPPSAESVAQLAAAGQIHVSPVGGVFVKKETRRSLLGMMLEELLETRVMVKQAMKTYHDDVLKRLLDARQLALKLIANVTYGYTAANWSGRMPSAEVADAIVAKGREALEQAILMIETDTKAGGLKYEGSEVIYGDTDSLFILMPGKSRADAFRIGRQIAADVTAQNPYPMKLKFEKVMMPCCLLAKKRYVGMSYEEEEQREGEFLAKGIETVRRDSCEFVAHAMETVLRMLFEKNVRGAVQYLQYKSENLQHVPLQHFVLSGDFRGQYAESAVLPMKKIAEELEALSVVHRPTHGQRLEYVVAEPPRHCVDPTVYSCVFRLERFLEEHELSIHYNFYMNRKLLPALARVFQLVPLVIHWQPIITKFCVVCNSDERGLLCRECSVDANQLAIVATHVARYEQIQQRANRECSKCLRLRPTMSLRAPCYNTFCPVWRCRFQMQASEVREVVNAHQHGSIMMTPFLRNIFD